jgi:murein DD-endopeptidase MepM/ murein hydrolase activator NlpD
LSQLLADVKQTFASWSQSLVEFQRRHPQRILAALGALLLVGGTASYAVATLGPDAARMPVQQWVQPLRLNLPQADTSVADLHLYRSDLTRSNDTADSLLQRLGVQDAAAAEFIRKTPVARSQLLGKSGRLVHAEADGQNQLLKLTVRWVSDDQTDQFQRLVIQRSREGWRLEQQAGQLTASTQLAGALIESSLFAATDQARIPDAVANQLADVFAGDIDFHRNLRKGDRFSVVYETMEADGEPMRTGRVLSAEFVNNNKTYTAVWFKEPGAARGEYYSVTGESLRRAYLTSPLVFSRITSVMGMRFHPILQTWKAHTGVDYAAPTGTAVRSVGDGMVEASGWQGGYGNTVVVRHRNGQSTLYAHLSKVLVRNGQTVSQGQNLGLVGMTGSATGPHLHFEFRVNGVHRDPLTLARQSESHPVSAAARAAFAQRVHQARIDLTAAASVQLLAVQ